MFCRKKKEIKSFCPITQNSMSLIWNIYEVLICRYIMPQ